MTKGYTLRIFKKIPPDKEYGIDHIELGSYEVENAPWVPRQGEFFRFRDPNPPGKDTDHTETAGRVMDVVTVFYGTQTVIEVYVLPRELF